MNAALLLIDFRCCRRRQQGQPFDLSAPQLLIVIAERERLNARRFATSQPYFQNGEAIRSNAPLTWSEHEARSSAGWTCDRDTARTSGSITVYRRAKFE